MWWVGDNVLDTPPEASGAEASPLEGMLVREFHSYVFLSLFAISLMVPKGWLGGLLLYDDGVHDEALDGQDARGHISVKHYNYNFRFHPKYWCNRPFKLKRAPAKGTDFASLRLPTYQETCSRGDKVHSCTSKASPGAVIWRCPRHRSSSPPTPGGGDAAYGSS